MKQVKAPQDTTRESQDLKCNTIQQDKLLISAVSERFLAYAAGPKGHTGVRVADMRDCFRAGAWQ